MKNFLKGGLGRVRIWVSGAKKSCRYGRDGEKGHGKGIRGLYLDGGGRKQAERGG